MRDGARIVVAFLVSAGCGLFEPVDPPLELYARCGPGASGTLHVDLRGERSSHDVGSICGQLTVLGTYRPGDVVRFTWERNGRTDVLDPTVGPLGIGASSAGGTTWDVMVRFDDAGLVLDGV